MRILATLLLLVFVCPMPAQGLKNFPVPEDAWRDDGARSRNIAEVDESALLQRRVFEATPEDERHASRLLTFMEVWNITGSIFFLAILARSCGIF